MTYIIQPRPIVGLSIFQSHQRFPVRRVYCVGRNYAEHAREMGGDPDREPPFFFCKPNDSESIVPIAPDVVAELPYPTQTQNYHYEVELVVAIGKDGENISVQNAAQHIFGYAVGLDMTRRDLQADMRQAGRPWEVGKAFDFSAPIGELCPVEQAGDIQAACIELSLNGEIKQQSRLSHLIWTIPETISKLSELFALKAGDLIFTGTPAGVGKAVKGDVLYARIEGLPSMTLRIK